MTGKISVVLTTYNRQKLLKRAIKSILNQSFEDFELVIVDDHSTDGTKKMVKKIKDDRIKYIRMPKNCGFDSKPKNTGIKKAKGKYIAFMDDDDTYRKDALKVLYNYITISKADLVYGDYIYHNRSMNKISKKENKLGWSVDFDITLLSRMNYIAMPVVMVKKECLLEVGGFDENIPKFKDWNLWIRLAKRGYKFLHIPIPITDVYVQEHSISSKYKIDTDKQGNYLPTYFNPADCNIYSTSTSIGSNKPLKVAIFSMTMDRAEYTEKCFKQMKKTAGYPYTHFVIDQASKDVKYLKNAEDIKVKFYDKNVGIAKGWNDAIEWIKKNGDYDIIIKVDNDAYFLTKMWLREIIDIFKKQRKIILSPYVEGLDSVPGGVLRQREGTSPYVMIGDKVLGMVSHLGGIVYATPTELYDDWKFEEDMKGNRDFILSQYAKSIGYQLMYLEETRVEHIEGTKGQHKRYPKYYDKMSYEKGV